MLPLVLAVCVSVPLVVVSILGAKQSRQKKKKEKESWAAAAVRQRTQAKNATPKHAFVRKVSPAPRPQPPPAPRKHEPTRAKTPQSQYQASELKTSTPNTKTMRSSLNFGQLSEIQPTRARSRSQYQQPAPKSVLCSRPPSPHITNKTDNTQRTTSTESGETTATTYKAPVPQCVAPTPVSPPPKHTTNDQTTDTQHTPTNSPKPATTPHRHRRRPTGNSRSDRASPSPPVTPRNGHNRHSLRSSAKARTTSTHKRRKHRTRKQGANDDVTQRSPTRQRHSESGAGLSLFREQPSGEFPTTLSPAALCGPNDHQQSSALIIDQIDLHAHSIQQYADQLLHEQTTALLNQTSSPAEPQSRLAEAVDSVMEMVSHHVAEPVKNMAVKTYSYVMHEEPTNQKETKQDQPKQDQTKQTPEKDESEKDATLSVSDPAAAEDDNEN